MKGSGKNKAICNFWLKFPSFLAKSIIKFRGEVCKRERTSIKIDEADKHPRAIWEIYEELFLEPASLCWMDGTLGAWGLPGRLAFF